MNNFLALTILFIAACGTPGVISTTSELPQGVPTDTPFQTGLYRSDGSSSTGTVSSVSSHPEQLDASATVDSSTHTDNNPDAQVDACKVTDSGRHHDTLDAHTKLCNVQANIVKDMYREVCGDNKKNPNCDSNKPENRVPQGGIPFWNRASKRTYDECMLELDTHEER